MGSLFGGSQQQSSSQSGNYAYPMISEASQPYINSGRGGLDLLTQYLNGNGIVNGMSSNQALAQTPGYQFALDSGSRAVNSNMASRGLFNSGAAGKALTEFGQNLGTQTYQNNINDLFKQAMLGTTAMSNLSDAGKWSTSTGTESSNNGGLGKAIGNLASTAALFLL